jgi:pimeloyl-ACP methyl ester carboxylesterase
MMGLMIESGHILSYRRTGQGRCLVLLHGFGEDGRIWDEVLSDLARHADVVVPNLPGCDGLDWPYHGDAYPTLEDMCDRLAETLSAADIDRCTLVGHSMGGYVSLAFAERHPDRVEGLVLLHSTAMPDSETKRSMRVRSISFMEQNGAAPFLREAIPALYAPAFRATHPGVIDRHVLQTLEWANPAVLVAHYRAMMERPDRRHLLQDSRWPSLFIAGALDKAVPLEESIQQTSGLPAGYLTIWPDAAHMGMKECPQELVAVLAAFLSHN